jgi:hypothetical protein
VFFVSDRTLWRVVGIFLQFGQTSGSNSDVNTFFFWCNVLEEKKRNEEEKRLYQLKKICIVT